MYDTELAFTGPTGLAIGGLTTGGAWVQLASMALLLLSLLMLVLAVRAKRTVQFESWSVPAPRP